MLEVNTLDPNTRTIGKGYQNDEDARWSGAAMKYLVMDNDTPIYLVKPDTGWPSDSIRERYAAAFYRACGMPVANVLRATVDETPAIAVRIIDNAEPLGDSGPWSLSPTQTDDMIRGAMLAAMIGDSDKHEYNWIVDDTRVYAIDHGLAFSGYIGKIPWTVGLILGRLVEHGLTTWDHMQEVIDSLPDRTYDLAVMAYQKLGVEFDNHVTDGDFRFALRLSLESVRERGEDYSDEDYENEEQTPVQPSCGQLTDHGGKGHTLTFDFTPRGRLHTRARMQSHFRFARTLGWHKCTLTATHRIGACFGTRSPLRPNTHDRECAACRRLWIAANGPMPRRTRADKGRRRKPMEARWVRHWGERLSRWTMR